MAAFDETTLAMLSLREEFEYENDMRNITNFHERQNCKKRKMQREIQIENVFMYVEKNTTYIMLAKLQLQDEDIPFIVECIQNMPPTDMGVFICLTNNNLRSPEILRSLLILRNVAFVDITRNYYTPSEWTYEDYIKLIFIVPFTAMHMIKSVDERFHDIVKSTHKKFVDVYLYLCYVKSERIHSKDGYLSDEISSEEVEEEEVGFEEEINLQ